MLGSFGAAFSKVAGYDAADEELRPSVNRVSTVERVGRFDEDPDLWPIRFEYEYGVRWVSAGGVKAVLEPSVA